MDRHRRTRPWALLVALLLLVAACSSGSGDDDAGPTAGGPLPGLADGGEGGDGEADQPVAAADEFADEEAAAGGEAAGDEGSFLGIWRSTQQTQFGPMEVETLFKPDGQFQQQSAAGGMLITIWGRFDVYEDDAHLRFTLEDWEPKEWCGPLGCEEIHYPTGESVTYRWVDEDTLMTAPRGCSGDQCWVTHHRA